MLVYDIVYLNNLYFIIIDYETSSCLWNSIIMIMMKCLPSEKD